MDLLIFSLEILLSLMFLYFGFLKVVMPVEKIEKRVSWARDYSETRLKIFGLLEILGAIGLIIPHQLNIYPLLTPMAATGLAMVMSGAIMVHLRRDELGMILLNFFIIFLLAGIGFHSLLDALGDDIYAN